MLARIKTRIQQYRHDRHFRGDRFHCPVCGCAAGRFLPRGLVPRANCACPHCGARERHRLFWAYLQKKTNVLSNKPMRVLHVAPEHMLKERFRNLFGDGYLTADLYAEGVDMAMDITDIQLPDDQFDFIYCSHVLEHVPDDRKAMREFKRVLKPSGLAILLVPITTTRTYEDPTVTDPIDREALYGQDDHVRRYGPDYEDRLVESGFDVRKWTPSDFLTSEEIAKYALSDPAAGEIFECRITKDAHTLISQIA